MIIERYKTLATEQSNHHSKTLDLMNPLAIVRLMNQEDRQVVRAVQRESASIAKVIGLIANAFKQDKHLIFIGAGTSGRLGVLEAAECPPTFNSPFDQVQGIMAGGPSAVFHSKEGAEDREKDGRKAVAAIASEGDIVIGVAASGVTPFVRAGLFEARKKKAKAVLVTCNPHPSKDLLLDACIALSVGPEVLAGSTRLKSGTACKMVLNMLTTGAFARSGKVYGPWMVDLKPSSKKLVARALHLIEHLGHVDSKEAKRLFKVAKGHVKTAVLMAQKKCSFREAQERLKSKGPFLREALK